MTILVVDVGATSIKWQSFDEDGNPSSVRRRATPSPCHPRELVRIITERVAHTNARRVAIGFPGDLDDGSVTDPANLARVGGPGSEVDSTVAAAWKRFELVRELNAVAPTTYVVVNDAQAAALGCVTNEGRHLVLTFGTGLGVALVEQGELIPIADVGGTAFLDSTFDEVVGEQARATDEDLWLERARQAIAELEQRFHPDVLHISGGNGPRIPRSALQNLGSRVIIERPHSALRGLYRMAREIGP